MHQIKTTEQLEQVVLDDLVSAWQTDIEEGASGLVAHQRFLLNDLDESPPDVPETLDVQACLGSWMQLRWQGLKPCRNCEAKVEKHFGGGYCYDCFTALARCDLCVMSPDRCHHHLGTCREPDWAEGFCMQPHVVYLAASSDVKVGISAAHRFMRRWVDQGAYQALVLARTPTRRTAGMLEAFCAQVTQDRIDWRRLVRGVRSNIELEQLRSALMRRLADFADLQRENYVAAPDALEIQDIQWQEPAEPISIEHPVWQYSTPQRLICAESQQFLEVQLYGLLGHYLLTSAGVLDLNSHRMQHIECRILPQLEGDSESHQQNAPTVQDEPPQASLF